MKRIIVLLSMVIGVSMFSINSHADISSYRASDGKYKFSFSGNILAFGTYRKNSYVTFSLKKTYGVKNTTVYLNFNENISSFDKNSLDTIKSMSKTDMAEIIVSCRKNKTVQRSANFHFGQFNVQKWLSGDCIVEKLRVAKR